MQTLAGGTSQPRLTTAGVEDNPGFAPCIVSQWCLACKLLQVQCTPHLCGQLKAAVVLLCFLSNVSISWPCKLLQVQVVPQLCGQVATVVARANFCLVAFGRCCFCHCNYAGAALPKPVCESPKVRRWSASEREQLLAKLPFGLIPPHVSSDHS